VQGEGCSYTFGCGALEDYSQLAARTIHGIDKPFPGSYIVANKKSNALTTPKLQGSIYDAYTATT
jgi:hypothetical protein